MFEIVGRREMRAGASLALICATALLATGCGSTKKPDLARACALQPCICKSTSSSIFSNPKAGSEVLWRQNGDAYCPEGHELRRVEE